MFSLLSKTTSNASNPGDKCAEPAQDRPSSHWHLLDCARRPYTHAEPIDPQLRPPWPTWVSETLAKQWPQIILQPLPPLSAPAPPRHRGRPPHTPRQRPGVEGGSSQTDGSEAIWRRRGAPRRVWDYRYAGHAMQATALTEEGKKTHVHARRWQDWGGGAGSGTLLRGQNLVTKHLAMTRYVWSVTFFFFFLLKRWTGKNEWQWTRDSSEEETEAQGHGVCRGRGGGVGVPPELRAPTRSS